ncbi:MAG: HNH endonuclease family protein [Acidimicrobiales bacterium]
MRRWLSRLDDAALVVVAAGGWWGYQELRPAAPPAAVVETVDPGATAGPEPRTLGDAGSARAALETLAVKGRAPKTGYARSQFGNGWGDFDRNGCDARNDILGRDLTDVAVRPGTNDCVVESGTLVDPYSADTVPFVKGNKTSTAVQIDHVVALSDAWQKGAQPWDDETRLRFANDPLNLLAVGQATNQAKGDGDAATWLPPAKPFRCAYVARQVAVKAAYGLWVTQAEHDAIARVLSACPAEPLPAETG